MFPQVNTMFMPIIRYKNESNSQLRQGSRRAMARCLCQSLDTRMKAIKEVKELCCKDTHYIWIHKILTALFSN